MLFLLFAALVHFLEQESKRTCWHGFRSVLNHCGDVSVRLGFILAESSADLELLIQLLHFSDKLWVIPPITPLQHRAFIGSKLGTLKSLDHQPRAFVLLNVGSDLTNHLWISETVKKVILCLEIFADREADFSRRIVVLRFRNSRKPHADRDREIKRIVCCLVAIDSVKRFRIKRFQLDLAWSRLRSQIEKLPNFRCVRDFLKQLDDAQIRLVRAQDVPQHAIDLRLEN
mmetsp:Transcript_11238/g.24187  ORF Transcript_11238/g.24187 Transcript_11238/m.24187 type:complete len:229 (+) Transcript_11238:3167-3853(+)